MLSVGMRGGHSGSWRANSTGRGAPEPPVLPVPPTTTSPPALDSTPRLNVEGLPPAVPHYDIESSASAPAGSSQTCGSTRRKNLSTADRNTTYDTIVFYGFYFVLLVGCLQGTLWFIVYWFVNFQIGFFQVLQLKLLRFSKRD